MRLTYLVAPLAALVLLSGCKQIGLAPAEVDESVVRETPGRREPSRVVVQHVLISHADAGIDGVTRTIPEAEKLAQEVLQRARGGTEFDELVRLYGDDRSNDGILGVVNYGVAQEKPGDVERTKLVKDFGAMAFRLEVGEIDVVAYEKDRSPFGYHVITRLQ
jgi:hypothetical protein